MSLEDEIAEMLRRGFEGSPEMLDSNFEDRDEFKPREVLLMLARGQKDLRDAILILAREVDRLSGP